VRTLNILRTQAFRIVLIYLALFGISAVGLVGFIYWNTTRVLDVQTDDTIDAEVTGLVEQYQRLGLPGLTDVIIGRSVRGGGQGLYVLANSDRRPIAGNLDSWPNAQIGRGGFVEFNYERRVGADLELRHARGKVFQLSQGGFFLLVARDIHDRTQLVSLFTTMLPWSVGLLLLFGLAGGYLLSHNFLARLDVINRTSRDIMAGDLSRRVPVTAAGDEFDDLAEHLNRMLDRIERLMAGMREVSDNVAHDLRTPLNRLRNRLESAFAHESPDSEVGRDIASAVEETDGLIATFNALLLIAEAEAGSVRESKEAADLSSIVEGVGDLYGPVADENGVSLSVNAGTNAVIKGNRNLLTQAVANLVDNAIKYTPKGGAVSLTLAPNSGGYAVVVADNGPGIPPSDRARVVERFVRLESSRNSPGTGLGLSLVAAVARLHDAQLVLEDNQPGLRVILRFPREVRAVPAIAAQ
jgi:hypothetical protein